MSIIIKSETGKEVELPQKLGIIVKPLGLESEMTLNHTIDVLKHGIIHVVAAGNSELYNKLSSVIKELETWKVTNVTIQY